MNPLRPFFWLLLYLVILYIRPQEYVEALLETPLVPTTLLLATGFWAVAQGKRFEAPQHGLMLLLAAAMFVSVLFTGWLGGAIATVTAFVPTMLLFYLVSTSVDSTARFRAICFVLTATSVVMALHGVDQVLSLQGLEQVRGQEGTGWTGAETIEGRITYLGFLNDPNDLSMAFLMSLPLTLYLARRPTPLLLRAVAVAAAGITLYGIWLCNSRGSVLGLAAMLGLYTVRRFGFLKGALALPVLVVALAFLSPSRSGELTMDDESAAGRVDAWYAAFEMFRSRPLFGVGAGLFTDHNPMTAHNSFVLAVAELGLVGYTIWLANLAVTALMLWRLARSPEPAAPPPAPAGPGWRGRPAQGPTGPRPAWTDVQACAASLGYAYAGALVAGFFLSRTYVVFLYLLIALVVAVWQLARRHWPGLEPVRLGPLVAPLAGLAVASIVGLFVLTGVLLRLA